MKRALAALLLAFTGGAHAHALQDRYDLPLPMAWVVAGGCAVVALTFVLAALFARAPSDAQTARRQRVLRVPAALTLATRTAGLLLSFVAVAAALAGTRDPLMNLAPTLVWIVWWLGLTFLSALFIDAWPLLDPWRTLDAAVRRLTKRRDPVFAWPRALGCWPAVALLLGWCWLEVVQPLASSPQKMGMYALAWTAVTLAGMQLFGRAAWQANADLFALTFSTFGRIAPFRLACDGPQSRQDEPGAGWPAFIVALLATVLFDGLHGSPAWPGFEMLLRKLPVPLDVNGVVAGTTGLVLAWFMVVLAFEAAAAVAWRLARADARVRVQLALTLLPIALGYAVAHNLSTFVLQGQRVFALLSDPFGRGWDLFGTAGFYPDIALFDARATWFIATLAVVCGHAVSIWWSHRALLAAAARPRLATVALLPLTLLMLAMTATSLLLLAAGEG